jgi:hypothetical protein
VLLVPAGAGYSLVERTGPAPEAGETVEVRSPETGDVSRYTVARVGRSPLPGGGVCVYLLSD